MKLHVAAVYSKRHLQRTCNSIPFFPQASHWQHFCLGMRRNQNFEIAFPFPPFLIFLLQWFTLYCTCFKFKTSRESLIETGTQYHGVAKCSQGKFCCEFFTQVSEHFHACFYVPANFFWVIGVRFLSWECQVFQRRHKHIQRFPKTSENSRRRGYQKNALATQTEDVS